MTSIPARLAAATGPDRELDARIWVALFPEQSVLLDSGSVRAMEPPVWGRLKDLPLEGWSDWEMVANMVLAPKLTASIDAAVALVERMLPKCGIFLNIPSGGLARAAIERPWLDQDTGWPGSEAATAPLAILRALFEAMEATAALRSRGRDRTRWDRGRACTTP